MRKQTVESKTKKKKEAFKLIPRKKNSEQISLTVLKSLHDKGNG